MKESTSAHKIEGFLTNSSGDVAYKYTLYLYLTNELKHLSFLSKTSFTLMF